MPRKPSITTGPASPYAGPGEIIREFRDGNGNGGLLSLRTTDDGALVELYGLDAKVEVRLPKRSLTQQQRGEVLSQSEAYAAGRMTHGYITKENLSQTQREVMHDVIMAAFQAGALAATEGTSVDVLLARMAELG